MNSEMDYALITGASLGIGKEIAKELSRRKYNTLLVALDTPELKELEHEIKDNYGTKVDSFGIDLTNPNAAQQIFYWCDDHDYTVSILINNAGFGEGGYFENIPLERYCNMIDLNNKAYISLIHKFLPGMKKLEFSHIMNTSSMEATLPLPYKAVYTGTKSFIYAYSLALNEEVRQFGMKVSILCPGGVTTTEEGLKRLKAQGAKGKLLNYMPDEVARNAVKNMLQGKLIINPGIINRLVVSILACIPLKLKMRLLGRIFSAYK